MKLIHQPDSNETASHWLRHQLTNDRWAEMRAAVAFVRSPGVAQIAPELQGFVGRARALVVAGIDNHCTSVEGLTQLHDALASPRSGLWVFHNEFPTSIFHPKLYVFYNSESAAVLVGSSNLTLGGLVTNYEGDIALELDRRDQAHESLLGELEAKLNSWMDDASDFVLRIDHDVIAHLASRGYIPPEVFANDPEADERPPRRQRDVESGLFGSQSYQPARRGSRGARPRDTQERLPWRLDGGTGPRGYVMTLQNTDVGTGQTTPGAARRSPEIFIPLGARDDEPNFWGWPDSYVQVPDKPHILNREGVRLRLGGTTVVATFMVDEVKHDLRIRSEAIRSAGSIGDILRVERPADDARFDYYVEIVPRESALYDTYDALCTTSVRRPSVKRYGYY